MKKHFFLTGILFLESVLFVNAQLTTASNEFHSKNDNDTIVEYATVGSVMPYKVSSFASGVLCQFFEPSIFKWWLNGNATGYELLKSDGTTPLQQLPPPNHVYYPDSSIAIRWVKQGKYTIRVSEKVRPKKGVQVCDHSESIRTLDVLVYNRPFIAWKDTNTIKGCDIAGTFQRIPVHFKGVKQVAIAYNITFTPWNDIKTDTIHLEKKVNLKKDDVLEVDTLELHLPPGRFGTYRIFIDDINDKVSRKSGIKANSEDKPLRPFVVQVIPPSNKPLFENNTISVCEGESVILKPSLAYNSIRWSNGTSDSTLLINRTGYYTAEAILPTGCSIRDSVYLAVNPTPNFYLGTDTSLCEEETLVLSPGIAAAKYEWSTGENSPSVTFKAGAGIVWAKVTSEYGCSFADTVLISSCKPQSLTSKIPNAFTPNNDSDNDTWTIELLDKYPDANVMVYNRWGQVVFKCLRNYNENAWDGTYNGKLLPMSTYFFVIDLKDGKAPIVGSVNLIR